MSAEHFETILAADARTMPNGRDVEWLEAGTGFPRGFGRDAFVAVKLYAEDALRITARAVREGPMDGISGDHPARRRVAADLIEATADVVRVLALDSAYDSELTDERWLDAIGRLRRVVDAAPRAGRGHGPAAAS